MKVCAQRHDYRDDLLRGAAKASFEAHLADCEACRKAISLWSVLEGELREMDREGKQGIPAPNAAVRQALIARARPDERPTFSPRLVAAFAALALVITGVAFYLTVTDDGSVEERDAVATPLGQDTAVQAVVKFISPSQTKTEKLSLAPGDAIPAADNARTLVLLGRDRIGFDEPTDAVLSEVDARTVRLKLRAGALACEVAPRDGGRVFEIVAGDATVRVVGTRFMVSLTDAATTVLVDEGVVEVHQKGRRPETTRAGQGLEIDPDGAAKRIEASAGARELINQLVMGHQRDRTPQPELDATATTGATDAGSGKDALSGPTPTREKGVDRGSDKAGLETWRTWVLAGRYDEAERALTAHLAKSPNDSEALVLLASCRRKAGKWRDAAAAYERLIQVAAPSRANTARFKAGVLYQERLRDHRRAVIAFEGYLGASSVRKPLEAEAMLRLGKSLLALGRTERAEAVLKEAAARQDGNPATLKARELLKKIGSGK